jgi:hypothetical protein
VNERLIRASRGAVTLWLDATVPRWLPLAHRAALPSLPGGISIREARERGSLVEFVLGVAPISKPLDLRSALPFDVP